MILPRFSIRTALAVVSLGAVISLFAGQAIGGWAWALGVLVGVASVPLALAFHVVLIAVAQGFARLTEPQVAVAHTSRGGVEPAAAPPSATSNPPTSRSAP